VIKDDKYYQIGVASYGSSKTDQLLHQDKNPSVYTRTASYCDWMTENTNGEFHCV
uniref:Peptidase S1 domain-containing protein n=1 Tax=Steinernema glaseri TaxID=37863 RepID=A0A1I8AER9_9BILA